MCSYEIKWDKNLHIAHPLLIDFKIIFKIFLPPFENSVLTNSQPYPIDHVVILDLEEKQHLNHSCSSVYENLIKKPVIFLIKIFFVKPYGKLKPFSSGMSYLPTKWLMKAFAESKWKLINTVPQVLVFFKILNT